MRTTSNWLYSIIGVLLLLAACSPGGTSETHYQQGKMLAGQSRSAEAMREYLLAVEADNDAEWVTKAVSELGHLSMNRHDYVQARDYFGKVWLMAAEQEDLPQMVLAQRDMGRCRRAEKQADEALRCFAKADSLLTAAGAPPEKERIF